jgi:hypothetical protein
MSDHRIVPDLLRLGFREITNDPQGMKVQEGFSEVPQDTEPLFVRIEKLRPDFPLTFAFIPATGCVYAIDRDVDLFRLGFRDVTHRIIERAVKNGRRE